MNTPTDPLMREAIEALLFNAEFMASGFVMHAPLSNGCHAEYSPDELTFRVFSDEKTVLFEGVMPDFRNSGDQ